MNFKKLFSVLIVFILIASSLYADQISDILSTIPDLEVFTEPRPDAPAFEICALDGTCLKYPELVSADLLFLNWWGSLCSSCSAEAPHKNQLWIDLKDYEGGNGFDMVCAAWPDTTQDAIDYMNDNSYVYPAYLDNGGIVKNLYGVVALPITFLISGGKVLARMEGPNLEWDTLAVEQALMDVIDILPLSQTKNLALDPAATATVSGTFPGYESTFPKEKAIDGNPAYPSLWGSNKSASGSIWYAVNLNNVNYTKITEIKVRFFNPARASQFQFCYTDVFTTSAIKWGPKLTSTGYNEWTVPVPDQKKWGWVGLYVNQLNPNPYDALGILEFEVIGY